MKAAAVAILLVILLALGGVLGFLAYIRSERTDCFASFDSHDAAERAAVLGRAAGFDDVDVEASGSKARRPTSPGARAISVTFSDGETGDDAASLRERFQEIVVQEDGEFSDPSCTERSRSD
jgi:hypothetical protein